MLKPLIFCTRADPGRSAKLLLAQRVDGLTSHRLQSLTTSLGDYITASRVIAMGSCSGKAFRRDKKDDGQKRSITSLDSVRASEHAVSMVNMGPDHGIP